MTIHPDGGVKRLRVFGVMDPSSGALSDVPVIKVIAEELTSEKFSKFGKVITTGWMVEGEGRGNGSNVKSVNFGTALVSDPNSYNYKLSRLS
jgi:hypothetical protein